jgi:transglutaminase-like putative cysteine protease
LIPTDGIVLQTALEITQSAKTDLDKVRAIYEWVVLNAWRDPAVLGCGEGDIQSMLATGNLGGKCADINALFVGLCRAAGVPARDVYGLRVGASAFGFKELSANPAKLQSSQHCRSEVYVNGKGWLAMDPADVAKVMRQETAEWVRDPHHPVVEPVYKGLFGGWEGNWIGFNTAHDVLLPQFSRHRISFLMYPVAEDEEGRFDSYTPDHFQYRITSKEVTV